MTEMVDRMGKKPMTRASVRAAGALGALLLGVILSAATAGGARRQDESKRVLSKEVFPVKKGSKWTYQAPDGEVTLSVEGTEKVGEQECTVLAWKVKDGVVKQFYAVTEDGVFLYKLSDINNKSVEYKDNPVPRLKFGTKKGDSWKSTTQGLEGTYENEGEEEIEVPTGKYKAWKIVGKTKIEGRDYKVTRWFASNVGLVKEERAPGAQAIAMELEKYEEGK